VSQLCYYSLWNLFHLDRLDGRVHGEGCEPAAARGNRPPGTATIKGVAGWNLRCRRLLNVSSSSCSAYSTPKTGTVAGQFHLLASCPCV